jgi:hypothetical protein
MAWNEHTTGKSVALLKILGFYQLGIVHCGFAKLRLHEIISNEPIVLVKQGVDLFGIDVLIGPTGPTRIHLSPAEPVNAS